MAKKPKKKLPDWVNQAAGSVAVPKGDKPIGSPPAYSGSGSKPQSKPKSKPSMGMSKTMKQVPKKKNPLGVDLPLRLGGSAAKIMKPEKLKVNKKYQNKVNSVLGI
ncbi:MAG TPA: hypothetical protein DDX98_06685 [Bacteroidales bacterium]|jgi:hypothetical protein|nr:hypothetical protein [Bacteroidales bacterium]